MNKKEAKNSPGRKFIIAILVLAGIRVFIFNAAFPIGNNVDEPAHLDLVCKYAEGRIPEKGIESYDRRTLELLIIYAGPEYFSGAVSASDILPLWKYPDVEKTEDFQNRLDSYLGEINHETGSFPVYYLCAGQCSNWGKFIGLNKGDLIYFLRFLNIPVFIAMVWIAYLTGKLLFPDNNFLQKGLPIMVAFFPQDSFYSITNDALSPLLFSLSFFMLMKILFEEKSLSFYFFTAAVIAVTFLNKITNITMLALLGLVIILKFRQIITERKLKENILRLFVLLGVSIIPLCLWMIRNYIVLGDITGDAAKIDFLGWKVRPFSQIWHHPIFSLSGLMFFLTELTKTFWRGEFVWHLKRISSNFFDLLYVISTGVFLLVSLVFLFRNKQKRQRTVFQLSFVLIAVSVLMLAVLSVLYDYGKCWYPSQEHPYFTSGRLIVTALVPFLILYLNGLEKLLTALKLRFNPLILVVFWVAAITISEIILTWKVFASPYNWFHLG
ncbi:MAG: DUF2142 domain-containing protein [Phycisphaerae bacterium]|jgi:hypothetical protein